MTVALQSPIVSYIGNGVSTVYTYPFYLLEASHMQAYKNGALQSPATYTLTSVGNPNGGEIAFQVAPTVGEVVILRRVVPATQLVDYQPFDPFPADTHERALDKLTMLVQDGFLTDTNSVRAPYLEPAGQANLILPSIPSRANFLLGFDPSGNVALYPQQGQEVTVTTAHGSLTGLSANDHPQYLLVADAFGTYLPKSGGTMTGPLTLMTGFPGGAFDAVPKSYVDTFIGTVITKNVTSNALGDAELTVHQAWNSQATTGGITRASNEIIYYRWPSTGTVIYRYAGSQQGPINWTTVASDWLAASGVSEAPLDLKTYGRNNAAWIEVLPTTGGVFTGPVTVGAFTTNGNVQVNGNGTVTGSWSSTSLAVSGNTTIGGTLNSGPITSPQINVTGPLLHADGTVAAPGISWVNEPGSGWLRASAGVFQYAIGGAAVIGVQTGLMTVQGSVAVANGAIGTPSLRFASSPTLGFFFDSVNGTTNLVWGGVNVWRGQGSLFEVIAPLTVHNQLTVSAGWAPNFAGWATAPIKNVAPAGQYPAIVMHNASANSAWIQTVDNNASYFIGSHLGAGPSGNLGWCMTMDNTGRAYARSFTAVPTTARSNVQPLIGALAGILSLHGTRYLDGETQEINLGLEAAEVELAFPELVRAVTASSLKAINYMALAAPIVEAIKELNARLTALEAR